jgi:hypothetical protein
MVVLETKERTTEWSCKAWNRTRWNEKVSYGEEVEVSPNMFYAINKYIKEELKEAEQERLAVVFHDIFDSFEIYSNDLKLLTTTLNVLILELFTIVDYHKLKTWAIKTNQINLSVGRKDTLTDKDSLDTTYFTDDYINLVVFSMQLKLIMPVWGVFYEYTNDLLGGKITLVYALELIRSELVESLPPFVKLQEHVQILVGKKIKTNGFTITADIGSEELPFYMLALLLWKKVCVFDPQVNNKSIIGDIYNRLMDQCERIRREEPSQKINMNPNGEESSIVDMYSMLQRLPPAVEVMATYDIINLPKHLGLLSVMGEINLTYSELLNNLDIKKFHLPILTCITGHILGNRTLMLFKYVDIVRVVAIVHHYLKREGLLCISELIISSGQPKENNTISLNGVLQLPISKEVLATLEDMYIFTYPDQPWVKWSEIIMKEVNLYEWNIPGRGIEYLMMELAHLLTIKNTIRSYKHV